MRSHRDKFPFGMDLSIFLGNIEGYKGARTAQLERKRVIKQAKQQLMAQTKEEQAEWQSHRDELKALWLDQRWTLEQIQDHMSQSHRFRKRSVGNTPGKSFSSG